MNLRIAKLEDSNKAVKLLLEFYKASDLPFPTNAAWAMALFKACVNDADKIAIMKDGGILLGLIGNSLLGPFKQAHEIVWWVSPDSRGGSLEMLKEYENWAEEQGAKLIEVKSLNKFPDSEYIYERLGYEPVETSWIKVV